MERPVRIIVSKDRLHAYTENAKTAITQEELESKLKEEKICYGIRHEALTEIGEYKDSTPELLIAEGLPPINGQDAKLVSEIINDHPVTAEEFNFRNVIKIPSVKAGQLLASIASQTAGTPGMDVYGREIPAKDGRPLKIKPGKNVVLKDNKIYSTMDGQLSVNSRSISVNPVFLVDGDIDLRTGNIDFIGNVMIKGDVPTGYEIKAGGDIRIFGLVEGAFLQAGGNIVVVGGITGAGKGKVISTGHVHAAYLNRADIIAGGDVFAAKSIINSNVQAGESVSCRDGTVIGGTIFAGKDIHIKELGSQLYTRTDIFPGHRPMVDEEEDALLGELKKTELNLAKVIEIEQFLIEKSKLKPGILTDDQKNIIMKQRATKQNLEDQLASIKFRLWDIEAIREEMASATVYIYKKAYPNVSIYFKKYSKKLVQETGRAKFFFSSGEIDHVPLL